MAATTRTPNRTFQKDSGLERAGGTERVGGIYDLPGVRAAVGGSSMNRSYTSVDVESSWI